MESTKINVNKITIKASSKKEVYRLLQLEGDVYMPQSLNQTTNMFQGFYQEPKR